MFFSRDRWLCIASTVCKFGPFVLKLLWSSIQHQSLLVKNITRAQPCRTIGNDICFILRHIIGFCHIRRGIARVVQLVWVTPGVTPNRGEVLEEFDTSLAAIVFCAQCPCLELWAWLLGTDCSAPSLEWSNLSAPCPTPMPGVPGMGARHRGLWLSQECQTPGIHTGMGAL